MHNQPVICFLSLGSNEGNREGYISKAIEEIKKLPGTILLKQSKLLNTKALEVIDQPDFLNCVIKIETTLRVLPLLDDLQAIEDKVGRIRRFSKGPREIDIDILNYGNLTMNTDRLSLPHHSLFSRPFIQALLKDMSEVHLLHVQSIQAQQ